MAPEGFQHPQFTGPVDVDAVLARIPEGRTVKGVFASYMLALLEKRGLVLASSFPRALPFKDYPLDTYARLLVEASQAFFPNAAPREALRRVGRGAYDVLESATFGRVLFSLSDGTAGLLRAAARAYEMTGYGRAVIVASHPNALHVQLEDVWTFLDCHHVGVFDGVMHRAGAKGEVLVRNVTDSSIELWCAWSDAGA